MDSKITPKNKGLVRRSQNKNSKFNEKEQSRTFSSNKK